MSPQGKKGNPAAAAKSAPAAATKSRSPLAGPIVFGVLLIALFAIVAVASGIGNPSVPDDAIAIVEGAPDPADEDADNSTVTKEQFDRALEQTAFRQGLEEVPATSDPQYQLIADAAQADLLLGRWVNGEAEERGIEVTEREIDQELEKVKTEQFGSEEDFDQFLEDNGFTLEEARERIKLQVISDRIQSAVLPDDPSVSDDEIEAFYDANKIQFQQPETRDVRVILTKDEADGDAALTALQADDSDGSFTDVAKKYSIDEATKSTGGLRPAVVAGQSEPALDTQIFSSPEGELVGPFKGDAGFYVIQVEKITPATTTPLDEATEQIKQTLVAARQQEIAQTFQTNFQNKWVSRTFCAEDFRIDRCANAKPLPDPCTKEVAESQGCDAPVPSTKPMAPGAATVFGSPAVPGLPQGPITPVPEVPAGGIPPGLTPVPGGAVPPGGAAPAPAPGG